MTPCLNGEMAKNEKIINFLPLIAWHTNVIFLKVDFLRFSTIETFLDIAILVNASTTDGLNPSPK